jgi:hypothetical protein
MSGIQAQLTRDARLRASSSILVNRVHPAACARSRLSWRNWKPRLFLAYLRRFGTGKGAVVLAALLFRDALE